MTEIDTTGEKRNDISRPYLSFQRVKVIFVSFYDPQGDVKCHAPVCISPGMCSHDLLSQNQRRAGNLGLALAKRSSSGKAIEQRKP